MKSRPVSLRLTEREIEALEARAVDVGGTPTGVARQLIRAGLAGGDAAAHGERLMQIERRLAAVDQQCQAILQLVEVEAQGLRRLSAMFDALIATLSGSDAMDESRP
jgi:hypothetical protein